MPVVEQTALIKAPLSIVVEALNDVASIPSWATVEGTIENIRGQGAGMQYDWRYTVGNLSFGGHSEVIEQTDTLLITKTSGDVDSLWTITMRAVGNKMTSVQVVVEYTSPNTFVEILADFVIQQFNDPEVAIENMQRFKEAVENRAKLAEEQSVVGS